MQEIITVILEKYLTGFLGEVGLHDVAVQNGILQFLLKIAMHFYNAFVGVVNNKIGAQ